MNKDTSYYVPLIVFLLTNITCYTVYPHCISYKLRKFILDLSTTISSGTSKHIDHFET